MHPIARVRIHRDWTLGEELQLKLFIGIQLMRAFFPGIFLNAVTDEQKAIRVHDFNRRISKNIKEVCESLDVQCVTPQYARNSFISALAHHGVMTAYIDYAVGHATSEVSALLAGYISNVTPAMMQAFNEKIFIVPPIM